MVNVAPPDFSWSPSTVSLLEANLQLGLSASRVAAILGTTRNAVIGKAARLGIELRSQKGGANSVVPARIAARAAPKGPPSAPRRLGLTAAPRPITVRPAPKPPRPAPRAMPEFTRDDRGRRVIDVAGARNVAFMDLAAHQCKFITDDPGPGRMHLATCCAADSGESNYCPGHAAICFNPSPSTGRDLERPRAPR